jgi:hypothetical protein
LLDQMIWKFSTGCNLNCVLSLGANSQIFFQVYQK